MLIFSDSFDDRPSANLVQGWTQIVGGNGPLPAIVAGVGRRGTYGYQAVRTNFGNCAWTSKTFSPLPGDNRFIIGFAFYMPTPFGNLSVGTNPDATGGSTEPWLWKIRKSNVTQCWARLNTNGTITVYQGTTARYTTVSVLAQSVSVYLEFDILVHASAGSIAVYVNGQLDGTGTISGVNTGASSNYDEMCLGAFMTNTMWDNWNFDDLYVCDGSGGRLNAPLGDTRVDCTLPNAAGNSSQWSRSAGADQWAGVDDPQANGDTDYNTSNTPGQVDTLNFPVTPIGSAGLHAVVVKLQVRKTDAGVAGMQAITRIGTVDYASAETLYPGGSYNVLRFLFALNPATAAPWLATDYDAAEFGYKKST
jgi:hypothetical protein